MGVSGLAGGRHNDFETPTCNFWLYLEGVPLRLNFWSNLPIRHKVMAAMGLVVVPLALVTVGVNSYFDAVGRQKDAAKQARDISEIVENLSKKYLNSFHYLDLESALEYVAMFGPVRKIEVYDSRRKIFVDGDHDTMTKGGEEPEAGLAAVLASGEMRERFIPGSVEVTFPIAVQGEPVAVGRITLARPPFARSLFEFSQRNLILALGMALAGLLVASRLARSLTQPIARLAHGVRAFAQGDYAAVPMVERKDEIGLLTREFSRMGRAISQQMVRIHELAFVDPVTELPNRERFRREAESAMQDARVHARPGALFFIDLDRFKRVNDSLGHEVGDELLRLFARRALGCVDGDHVFAALRAEAHNPNQGPLVVSGAVLARHGGDEFTLLLPEMRDVMEASIMAGRILDVAKAPFDVGGTSVSIGASIGIAIFPNDAEDYAELLKRADLAMYHAKENGRNQYQFYSSALNAAADQRMRVEIGLRQALINDEIEVFYQPKVDCRTQKVLGVEALVRWRHPQRGVLAPGEFLAVAEETGLIVEIGKVVLRKACQQGVRWLAAGHVLDLAVNVSMAQFTQEDFAETITEILQETLFPPRLLELELTESMAMTDPSRAARLVAPLRALGVRFAIDDFGTGYSSLAHLTELPFDVFKIDQSFIRNVSGAPESRTIVETILAMAESLKYKTIAEGVETAEQAQFLVESGCQMAQGYLFAKPMPSDDLTSWITRNAQLSRPSEASTTPLCAVG